MRSALLATVLLAGAAGVAACTSTGGANRPNRCFFASDEYVGLVGDSGNRSGVVLVCDPSQLNAWGQERYRDSLTPGGPGAGPGRGVQP